MMKKIIASAVVIFSMISQAQAQEQAWTLKQCIAHGLKNQISVKVYQNEKHVADQRARQAVSSYLPQVNGNASLDDNVKRQVSVLPAGTFGPEPVKVAFGTQYLSTMSAQLTQTIYDQALLVGIKASKPNKDYAELSARQNDENIIYTVSQAYYQILISKAQLRLLEHNEEMYDKLLPVIQLQVDKGVTAKVELDKVNVNLNNTLSQITATKNIIAQANNSLKFQMGIYDDGSELVLADTSVLEGVMPEIKKVMAFDYMQQTNYKLQQTTIRLQELDAEHIRAGGLPKLSMYANYGAQAMNNDFGKLYNNLYDYSAVGLRLSIPIFDGFNRNSQYKQTMWNISSARENLKLNEAAARLQYENAFTQLSQTQLTLENNKRNILLAQKVFNTTSLQYQKGVNPFSDVLNADQSLKDAQSTFIKTLLNYYQAKLDLEKANGTLNQFYNSLN